MNVNCPYCNNDFEVDYGYDQDSLHEVECSKCKKYFVFNTSIIYLTNSTKADCLNNGKHEYKRTATFPKEFSRMQCETCGIERDMTDEERTKFNIGTMKDYFKKLKNNE